MTTYSLIAANISKSYGRRLVLDDVTVCLEPGKATGLIGANGAGKTTLLMVLAGFLHPDGGTVKLGNSTQSTDLRPHVMLLQDRPAFYPRLTVYETLRLFTELNGLVKQDRRIREALERVSLSNASGQRTGTLSMGMRQRLAWAHALLQQPAVLLLDEPSSFLDPQGVKMLRSFVNQLAETGTAVLMSSHNMHEIVRVCGEIMTLENGSITTQVNDGTVTVDSLEEAF